MATTYIYLDPVDITKLLLGEKVEIQMTNALRSSNRLFLRAKEDTNDTYIYLSSEDLEKLGNGKIAMAKVSDNFMVSIQKYPKEK